MITRFQPTRLMTPVLIFLCICAFSYWVNPVPWHHLDLTTKTLFAFAALVLVGLVIALRNRLYLCIDDRGLKIQYPFGAPRFYAWADIESARIFSKRIFLIPVISTIRLTLHPGARSSDPVRRAASFVTRSDATFPAFFDLSAAEILERINSYKIRTGP
jgi:hypothetical protein